MKNRLGLNIENKDVDFNELIKFLRDSYNSNPPDAKKAELKNEEWKESVHNTGFNIDTSNNLLKYWYTPAEEIPTADLSDSWNWKDIKGVSYINEAIRQVKYIIWLI